MKNPVNIPALVLSAMLLTACNEAKIPSVITNTVTEITTSTAVSGGVISDDGGGMILEKGLCWDTIGRPKTGGLMITDSTESFSFTDLMTGLSPKTTYYVKAFATNIAGTGYGNMETFVTLGDQPGVTILEATDIGTHTVTLNGSLNPGLLETVAIFEYGVSTAYGETIYASLNPVSGDTETEIHASVSGLTPGTEYHYRVRAENSLGVASSNDKVFTTAGDLPSAETKEVTDLKISTVTLNGSANPNDLTTSVVFEWGLSPSYGNSASPVLNNLTGTDALDVSAALSGLSPGTTYHYRISASNEMGTTSGEDKTFKTYVVADADNNYYYSVAIGTQTWLQQNLRSSKLRDGTAVTYVSDNTVWKDLTTSAYCWYNNDEEGNKNKYGALYNWPAVSSGKLCPQGWHVPSNSEWITLTNYLGGEITAGTRLKEAGDINWGSLNTGTNDTGFTGLPGGIRNDDGSFTDMGSSAHFWSTSAILPSTSYSAVLYHNSTSLVRAGAPVSSGLSVRCIKD